MQGYEDVTLYKLTPERERELVDKQIECNFIWTNKEGHGIADSPISPVQLGGLIDLIAKGDISGKIAKDVFEILWTEGGDPAKIVEDRGMKQVTDMGAIEAAVDEVIAANPDKVAQAQAKPSLAGWFVGQVMKATGGKANPKAVNDIVRGKLGIG